MAGALGGRTFRSLRRHRNYRLYFFGQVISMSGTWMQNTAQAWLVLQLTGSARAVGVLAVCQFGPYALLGLGGGVASDRFDRRRILLATQSVPIVFAATLAVLAGTDRATLWEVYLLAAGNGLVQIFDAPARQAFTIEMVGRSELPNAVALNSSLFNASRIIGPGIAGLIIAGAGVTACFALNALSYVAVLAGLLLMRPAELFRGARGRRPSVLRGIADGLAYAARTPRVRVVLVTMMVIGTISVNFNVLLPVLAATTLHDGPQALGLLSASFGAGALLGALVCAALARADMRLLVGGALALGLCEIMVAPQTGLVGAAALLGVGGIGFTIYTSQSNSILQLTVPDRLRGRVLSLYAYVFFGTAPIGGFVAGWLAERGGTRFAFLVAGSTAVAMAVVCAAWWAAGAERRAAAGAALDGAAAEADSRLGMLVS